MEQLPTSTTPAVRSRSSAPGRSAVFARASPFQLFTVSTSSHQVIVRGTPARAANAGATPAACRPWS